MILWVCRERDVQLQRDTAVAVGLGACGEHIDMVDSRHHMHLTEDRR